MVSPAMAIKEEDDGRSQSVLPTGNGISLKVCSVQPKDQFTNGDDYAPKVRKPYTITKQRERWTEEEHKKFVEALKLHGRAWRKIEEHVGTKTAVQIRSHAQKFFSKVSRDPNGSNTISEEPIEIPPPRPKRKPVHPYPRKLVNQLNKEYSMVEAPTMPSSPNCSLSEQENQSPKSVLPCIGSDSNIPNGSVSPVSSTSFMHSGFLSPSESNLSSENKSPSPEEKKSPSPPTLTEFPMKLELFPQENVYEERCSTEEESMRSLKLFGQIVLVVDSHKPSSLTRGDFKTLPSDVLECKPVKLVPLNAAINSSKGIKVHIPSHLSHGSHGAFNLMHFQNENPNHGALVSPTSVTCWPNYGALPSMFVSFNKQESTGKECFDSNAGKGQEREVEEGSLTGSNTGSVNGEEDGDKCLDFNLQSCQCSAGNDEKEPVSVFKLKHSSNSAFCELKASRGLCKKGFVPYKRCTSERYTQASSISGEEREEKRVRLCL